MENSPLMVDWDSGSSCWTLGRENQRGYRGHLGSIIIHASNVYIIHIAPNSFPLPYTLRVGSPISGQIHILPKPDLRASWAKFPYFLGGSPSAEVALICQDVTSWWFQPLGRILYSQLDHETPRCGRKIQKKKKTLYPPHGIYHPGN